MKLIEIIDEDLKQALKEQKELELSVLRMLKTSLKNAEIAAKGNLSQDDAMKVLNTQAKQRKDSMSQFEKAGRTDLAEKEKKELVIIESYLPEKMGEDEVRTIAQAKISEAGDDLSFGKIMGSVMKEVGQSADGETVRKVVQEEIDKKNG